MISRFFLELVICSGVITSAIAASKSLPFLSTEGWLGPEFGVLQKVYDDCLDKNDFTGCLKGKALVALTKAVDQDSVPIIDGVTLEKQNSSDVDSTPSITTPKSLDGLTGIDRVLMQKLDKFLRTHVVKLDMSESRHKKNKKMHKYVLPAFITAMGIAGPLGLKVLATIAGKALIISKVALTIASIIALQKLYSSDNHQEKSFQLYPGEEEKRRRNMYISPIIKSESDDHDQSLGMDPYLYYNNYNSNSLNNDNDNNKYQYQNY